MEQRPSYLPMHYSASSLGEAENLAPASQLNQAEHLDIFQILEHWEAPESIAGPFMTPFGSVPVQTSYGGHPEGAYPHYQEAAPCAPVPDTLPLPRRATPWSAFQQNPDDASGDLQRRATYPMIAPGPYLHSRQVRESSVHPRAVRGSTLHKAYPSAETPWQQQPFHVPQQHHLPAAFVTQGSHLSSSASLDAEDSTATAAAGSPVETRPSGKRHKSEVWRQKNRQAQKNFRQRKKEKWRFQEEELTRLTNEVDILLQRRQELQELLSPGKREHLDPAAKTDLVLNLELAQVVLTQRDVEEMQVEGIAEIWKGMTEKMGLYLPEAQRNPSGAIARRLQALENEAIQLLGVLADVNPRVLTAIEGMALELGSNKGKESGPWVSVLEQLQLTREQAIAMRAVHKALGSNLKELLSERLALLSSLQERHIEGFQLKVARQLVQQIEANVHAAFVCKTYFASHAWIKVLRPLQRAQFIVSAYPFGADMLSLLTVAAKPVGSANACEQETDPDILSAPSNQVMLPGASDWHAALQQPLRVLHRTT